MRSESRTPAARWAASNTDVQSGRGPPGSGASIGSRICPAACEERASARVRSWPREKGRLISGSYAETATRSAGTFLEASSISLLLPTPGPPSTTTAVGRRSRRARATTARITSSSSVRPKNSAMPPHYREVVLYWIRGSSPMIRACGFSIVIPSTRSRRSARAEEGRGDARTGGHVRVERHQRGAVPRGCRAGHEALREPSRAPREDLAPGPGDEHVRRRVHLGRSGGLRALPQGRDLQRDQGRPQPEKRRVPRLRSL